MRKKIEITQEDFDGLLGWLSSDVEEAGKKYEEIRNGLIRFFYYRGSPDAESLADETINRVAAKLAGTKFDENFKLASYFYSFAAKIYLEDYKHRKKFVYEREDLAVLPPSKENNPGVACLERCLAKHPVEERTLLIKYYGFGKSERAEQRRLLAAERNINILFLHTKISRLKKVLRVCLRKCLDGKKT
jgi:DNA-directed RNA polymerase specialized sigma24 family protein